MEMKLKYPQIYEYFTAEDTPALLTKINQSKQSLRYKLSSWEKLKFPIEFFTYQGFLRPLKDSEGNWYKNVSDAAEALGVRYYDITKARAKTLEEAIEKREQKLREAEEFAKTSKLIEETK